MVRREPERAPSRGRWRRASVWTTSTPGRCTVPSRWPRCVTGSIRRCRRGRRTGRGCQPRGRRARSAGRWRRRHGRDPQPRGHRSGERGCRQQRRSRGARSPATDLGDRARRRSDRRPRHRLGGVPRCRVEAVPHRLAAGACRARVAEAGGDVDEIEAAIARRDHHDSTRADSPLTEADGAIVVDTTGLSVDEVLDRIEQLLERE